MHSLTWSLPKVKRFVFMKLKCQPCVQRHLQKGRKGMKTPFPVYLSSPSASELSPALHSTLPFPDLRTFQPQNHCPLGTYIMRSQELKGLLAILAPLQAGPILPLWFRHEVHTDDQHLP